MPTDIQPDNPNATGAGRLQAMVGGREPGTPSMAGKPGVQSARHSFPAPPAPNTAPAGKPPDGARKAMGGTQPQQPGTPAPGAAPSSAPPQSAGAPPPTPGSPQPAPGAGSSVSKGVGAPEAPPAPTVDQNGQATQTFASATIPKPGSVQPGTAVQTPYGTASHDSATGGSALALDAAGQQKYKESMAALRNKFTVPRVMKGMQGLPQMNIRLGVPNFDPFSGRFHGKD